MKSGFKKCLIAAVGLSVLVLTACSSGNDTGETISKIHWFSDVSGWGPGAWNTNTAPSLNYYQEKLGIDFDIEQPPVDAATKLGLMIAQDDLPDVMSITDADTIKQLIEADKVWNLEEFLETYDEESHLLQNFPNDVKEVITERDGGWFAIPSHMESPDNREIFPPSDQIWVDVAQVGKNHAIIINTEIMEQVGITEEELQSEESFYQALQKVKDAEMKVDDKDVIPLLLHGDLWMDSSLDSILQWNFGAVPVDENGDYRHVELSPGYKNAMKFINNTIQNGYLDVNSMTIDETALKTYVAENRVFCLIGNQANFNKDNLPLTSFGPIFPANGAKPVLPKTLSAGSGWIQTFVSKDAKDPEKIAKFLSWSTEKDGLMKLYYGEENDYEVDTNGIVRRNDDAIKTLSEDYNNNILLWPFANTSFERHTQPIPDPGSDVAIANDLMTAFGKNDDVQSYDDALLSFRNATIIEPSSDLGIKERQIKNYLESQKGKIVTAKDDATFEKEYQNMIDTLNSYDVDRIDEEYNIIYQEMIKKVGSKIEDVNAHLYN
ncbi:extracellular solute-binding protein [Enterococcus casseliflavus]|uniref:extracellular solute-binding protein n=1 Tax=Enterococcus casseliflavus TaxID=37734 RepID=UPI002FBE9192